MNADLNCRSAISHHSTLSAVISLNPDYPNRASASPDESPSGSDVPSCSRISSSGRVATGKTVIGGAVRLSPYYHGDST